MRHGRAVMQSIMAAGAVFTDIFQSFSLAIARPW
jgi:hypothetical protein